MSAPAAVQVDGLSRRFGAVLAVDDLSFTVETGSLLTLLGPNGAGKTTTVEICEGFQRPDEGSVRVLGLDPISGPGHVSGPGWASCSRPGVPTAPPAPRRCWN